MMATKSKGHRVECLRTRTIEVLPLPQLGCHKWKELGLAYTLNDIQTPTPEMLERACDQFRKVGLKAH